MASNILKGFAIAAGLGLAVGLGTGKQRREDRSTGANLPADGPSLEPVLERLDRIESRLSAVEIRPPAITAEDIGMLQLQVTEHRQKVAGEVATIEDRFADLTQGISALLESVIVPRVADLRAHLQSELQQSVSVTLTRFERAIDDKISGRISTLEKTMLDQSRIVTSLSQRANESDMHLQRLISAVERYCERTSLSPAAGKEPSFLDQPFDSGFRARFLKEDDNDKQPRPRVPLTSL
jgi:uncharacterized coiled-coil protein SlyX